MKYSKRYIALTLILAIVFFSNFFIFAKDNSTAAKFRGAVLEEETWSPLVADDVNGGTITVTIDNREYSSKDITFYMDDRRNIMVPVSMLRDALDCSAHVYSNYALMVEKHSLEASLTVDGSSDFINRDGEFYVSLNKLAEMLDCSVSFDMENKNLVITDPSYGTAMLPTKFDLRDKLRVPEIRNQGSYGTCWASASISAMESTLNPEASPMYSVDHMSMSNSFSGTQYDGGEYTMAMAYLAAWQGPVYEKDDPYGDGVTDSTLSPVKHVQEIRVIDSKDYQGIKEAVFKYGGVQSSIYSSIRSSQPQSEQYNRNTKAYCYIGTAKPNHDIVIIGWDDNYSKDNFNTPLEGDGAFICQNSWGDAFGEEGVFYISYYDTNIGTHNVVYTGIEEPDNYDNIYQSDLCGWIGKIGYGKSAIYGANVFEAKSDETIKAASFYATAADTSYKVYVVENFEDASSLKERDQVAEGVLSNAGYYTIDFSKDITVKAGEKFAIVVYLDTPGATHPMAIEYNSGEPHLRGVDLDDGEGYISLDGELFIDVKNKQECNLCIKAFTDNGR